ncbi:MAG: hypothetical protein D6696_15155 [Acidobacteria bacterium]|nr:MAG: hypothetical protein D6696_15155 [Acidobacteriota bacterium]
MDKLRILISASPADRRVAEALLISLEPELECVPSFQDAAEPDAGRLSDVVADCDLALFVTGAGDDEAPAPPLFASGLLAGILGPERVSIVLPQGSDERPPLPQLRVMTYDAQRFKQQGRPALAVIAATIKEYAERLGRRHRLPGASARMIEDSFKRTGLSNAYRAREDARHDMLNDVEAARRSVSLYARVYITELIKRPPQFAAALKRAATNVQAGRLVVTHTSTSPRNAPLAGKAWELEDPLRERWQSVEEYQRHLKRSDDLFTKTHQVLSEEVASGEAQARASVLFVRRYLTKVIPYSMVVIDGCILYVSFYSMSRDERYGKFAPTMRLTCDGDDGDSWAHAFLHEQRDIDGKFSDDGETFPLI